MQKQFYCFLIINKISNVTPKCFTFKSNLLWKWRFVTCIDDLVFVVLHLIMCSVLLVSSILLFKQWILGNEFSIQNGCVWSGSYHDCSISLTALKNKYDLSKYLGQRSSLITLNDKWIEWFDVFKLIRKIITSNDPYLQ